jgi:hypothetical protein
VNNAASIVDARRNRIVNGAMQVSQENGNTVGTTNGFYPADQWTVIFGTTGVINVQRVQIVTPNGSVNRLRVAVPTADASLAAGEILLIQQYIEGLRIADFRYGTASARQSILRFGFKGPAGTYAASIVNLTDARSYIALFTISAGQANTDTEQTLVIPGDTTGSWASDVSIGFRFRITLAAGTSFNGAAGWQAGNFISTSSVTNGMATAGNTFELFDVGLYLDAANTGVAPRWETPDEAEELEACYRYYLKQAAIVQTSVNWCSNTLPATMRVNPAVTGGGAGFTVGAPGNVFIGMYQTAVTAPVLTFDARM